MSEERSIRAVRGSLGVTKDMVKMVSQFKLDHGLSNATQVLETWYAAYKRESDGGSGKHEVNR